MLFCCSSDLESFPTVPLLLLRVLVFSLLYTSHSFKPWPFFCAQRQKDLYLIGHSYASPLLFALLGVGLSWLPCLRLSCWLLAFSLSSVVQYLFSQLPVLLQEELFYYWCNLMEEVSSESSYVTVLNQAPSTHI